MILGFITTFVAIMFLVSTSELLGGDTWYIWFGCTLQGIGGFMGLCGPCCKSPTMIFYYFVWVLLGMFWWMLWASLDISNMINQGYDGDSQMTSDWAWYVNILLCMQLLYISPSVYTVLRLLK